MGRIQVTREKYEFREIPLRAENAEPLALFTVDMPNGQSRDELLSFTVVETRIRLWEEAVQQMPALSWQDALGFQNYRQYVRALVEGLKTDVA